MEPRYPVTSDCLQIREEASASLIPPRGTVVNESQKTRARRWSDIVKPYARPDTKRAVWQLLNSIVPFLALWVLMWKSLDWSYAITLALAVPTVGFMIRIFIIQHDCGHGSFLGSRRVNDAIGFVLGVIMLTPYGYWRKTHAIHHATSGDLDRRKFGDVTTLTVREYLALPWWRRLGYRFYRHPLVLLGIGPAYQFFLKHRLPFDLPFSWKREWASVLWTNLALVGVGFFMHWTIGFKAFLMVQLPLNFIAGIAGVWLFYVQHQFEDTYWEAGKDWTFEEAAIHGSSYYDLPPFLHWFTGNIGVHHVHHLSSRIPNYNLQRCMRENPELHDVNRLTIRRSLGCLRLKLWDEDARKLVGFRRLREHARAA